MKAKTMTKTKSARPYTRQAKLAKKASHEIVLDLSGEWPIIGSIPFVPQSSLKRSKWDQLTMSQRREVEHFLAARGREIEPPTNGAEWLAHYPKFEVPEVQIVGDGCTVIYDGTHILDDYGRALYRDIWNRIRTADQKKIRDWACRQGRELRMDDERVWIAVVRKPLELCETIPDDHMFCFDVDSVRHHREISIVVQGCDNEREAETKFRLWLEDVIAHGLAPRI